MLVQVNDVSKSFGSHEVLGNVSFQVNPSEKIGLIGGNGAGKTTLLKLIAGALEPDLGTIVRKANLQVATLDQIPDFHEDTSVLEEGLRSSSFLLEAEHELRRLEHEIASETRTDIVERYSQLQHEFELKGGYSFRARTEAALLGVGFSKQALDRPSRNLSGGEKNRLALAKLLLSNTDLLLLDEPTNHLDIRAIEWLESFLKNTDRTTIVVSHDRFFLDRVTNRIIELADGRVASFRGNYSDYQKQKAERVARQEKQWQLQREWIRKEEDYIRRNIAGQKTKQAQSRRKLLSRIKPVEKPKTTSSQVKFRFLPVERSGRYVLNARNLDIGYENTPIVRTIQLEVQRGERWAILGPNGSGKTTLLRTLIGQLLPVQGELDWREALEVGYYDQQLQDLQPESLVLDHIRELDTTASDGELRSYLALFLFSGDDVFKEVRQLSGGEKSRLMLAKVIYTAPQLLAMDEPTNHLDIASREALESALAEYPGTLLFVTHDRYLVRKIATHLLYIEDGKVQAFDRFTAFEEWLADSEARRLNFVHPHPPLRGTLSLRERDAGIKPAATNSLQWPRRGLYARGTISGREKDLDAGTRLSKNKLAQLQREAAELEAKIASTESELAQLELAFQNPGPGIDWEAAHRRHAELKDTLNELYEDLGNRWEMMGRMG